MTPAITTTAELIVYACPTGPLAEQIEHFYEVSRERFGPNSAHTYPAHITLTGFFHDTATSVGAYAGALAEAHAAAMPRRPAEAIVITEMALKQAFHGLLIASPWLEAMSADFVARDGSPTRRDPLRVKNWLHLSLAYGFRPEHGPGLAALARELVDPTAPAGWELRLYERIADSAWEVHGSWPI